MVKEQEEKQDNEEKLSEAKLIERIINGEKELFSEIIDKYQKRILILTQRYILNREDADDAVQEIFIKVYDNLGKFKLKSSLGTWIYRIAVNHCLEIKRKESSKKNLYIVKDYDEHIDKITSEFKSPEQVVEEKELANRINDIVNRKLSKNQKAVFMLRYLDELPIKDIAYILDMKEGTVKTHLGRSYDKIREEIIKDYQ
jgi:RNA polymerase sigma-70 factor (ECF subfamily)